MCALLISLLLLIALYSLVVLLFGFHDLPPMMVSKNIKESKKNQVFIRECNIANIEVFDTSYQFPFKQTWEEKRWRRDLNYEKKMVIVIDSLSYQIVFELKSKNDYKLFYGSDFNERWIIRSDCNNTSGFGSMGGMLYVSVLNVCNDSTKLSFTIYRKNTYNLEDDLTLFTFDLYRDN